MKMEPIVSSETSAIRTQTLGNYPKRNKLHLEHGESLKTRLQYNITTVIVDSNLFRLRKPVVSRPQWPRGLRRRSAAARLLRLWVRIPPGAWMFVCCECCLLSCRGLCDELITRPESPTECGATSCVM